MGRCRRDVGPPDAVALLEPQRVGQRGNRRPRPRVAVPPPRGCARARARTPPGSTARSRARPRRSRAGRAPARRRHTGRVAHRHVRERVVEDPGSASGWSRSRARGPTGRCTPHCGVTSRTATPAAGGVARIHSRSWLPNAVPVTIERAPPPGAQPVKSHSIPPRAIHLGGSVIWPTPCATRLSHRCSSSSAAPDPRSPARRTTTRRRSRRCRGRRRARRRWPATSAVLPSRAGAAPRRRPRRSTRTSSPAPSRTSRRRQRCGLGASPRRARRAGDLPAERSWPGYRMS